MVEWTAERVVRVGRVALDVIPRRGAAEVHGTVLKNKLQLLHEQLDLRPINPE